MQRLHQCSELPSEHRSSSWLLKRLWVNCISRALYINRHLLKPTICHLRKPLKTRRPINRHQFLNLTNRQHTRANSHNHTIRELYTFADIIGAMGHMFMLTRAVARSAVT